ncbi:hypothetical protein AG1IA_09855 [Rhizoctonia solani AG-1 IA]|uniref:Uncharacterized protein n=1 Tax=Thanatephorus cucumeris (strain AG1-IA) TaxID=983506 RepID=L8WDT8_THACA|nr:hypothetical protein AG1IA_09855 [Rhizoctonia solani AG-1 IA]
MAHLILSSFSSATRSLRFKLWNLRSALETGASRLETCLISGSNAALLAVVIEEKSEWHNSRIPPNDDEITSIASNWRQVFKCEDLHLDDLLTILSHPEDCNSEPFEQLAEMENANKQALRTHLLNQEGTKKRKDDIRSQVLSLFYARLFPSEQLVWRKRLGSGVMKIKFICHPNSQSDLSPTTRVPRILPEREQRERLYVLDTANPVGKRSAQKSLTKGIAVLPDIGPGEPAGHSEDRSKEDAGASSNVGGRV